jgi:hypothetical protein
MSETRYRLKLWAAETFSIIWAAHRTEYVPGDCLVVAAAEEPSLGSPPGSWTELMTLADARTLIAKRPETLGVLIRDCLGLILPEEKYRDVPFTVPIRIRNQTESLRS